MLPTALVTNLAAPVAPEFWDPSRGMVVDGADLRFDFGRGGLGVGLRGRGGVLGLEVNSLVVWHISRQRRTSGGDVVGYLYWRGWCQPRGAVPKPAGDDDVKASLGPGWAGLGSNSWLSWIFRYILGKYGN